MADSFSDFVAGYVGGAAGIVLGSPLDIIKVQLQSGTASSAAVGSDSVVSQFTGLGSLVRGAAAPILGQGALNAILFVSYNRALEALGDSPAHPTSLAKIWTAGAVGGLACFVVSTPTELVKCRAQARFDSRNSWDISKEIFRERGVRGFFHGGTITCLRDSIGYGFYFWAYEACKQSAVFDQASPATKSLVAGGIAGCVTWASVYPLDVVKTLVQVQQVESESAPLLRIQNRGIGAIACAKEIYGRGGMTEFFRGFWACMARAFVVNAVTFFTYELVMRKMQAG